MYPATHLLFGDHFFFFFFCVSKVIANNIPQLLIQAELNAPEGYISCRLAPGSHEELDCIPMDASQVGMLAR